MDDSAAPVGIVSPHLDDAVLSCGQLLRAHPGSRVVTVFSGGPARVDPLPEWDALSGVFSPGDDVMAARRAEDDRALAQLSAEGGRLGFWEIQYRRAPARPMSRWRRRLRGRRRVQPESPPDPELVASVARELAAAVDASALDSWFVPLGLVHPDHAATAAAGLEVAARRPELSWFVYEELPYGVERPELVGDALASLAERGLALTPAEPALDPDLPAKRAAVDCYRSQVPCLGQRVDRAVAGPECYHRVLAKVPAS